MKMPTYNSFITDVQALRVRMVNNAAGFAAGSTQRQFVDETLQIMDEFIERKDEASWKRFSERLGNHKPFENLEQNPTKDEIHTRIKNENDIKEFHLHSWIQNAFSGLTLLQYHDALQNVVNDKLAYNEERAKLNDLRKEAIETIAPYGSYENLEKQYDDAVDYRDAIQKQVTELVDEKVEYNQNALQAARVNITLADREISGIDELLKQQDREIYTRLREVERLQNDRAALEREEKAMSAELERKLDELEERNRALTGSIDTAQATIKNMQFAGGVITFSAEEVMDSNKFFDRIAAEENSVSGIKGWFAASDKKNLVAERKKYIDAMKNQKAANALEDEKREIKNSLSAKDYEVAVNIKNSLSKNPNLRNMLPDANPINKAAKELYALQEKLEKEYFAIHPDEKKTRQADLRNRLSTPEGIDVVASHIADARNDQLNAAYHNAPNDTIKAELSAINEMALKRDGYLKAGVDTRLEMEKNQKELVDNAIEIQRIKNDINELKQSDRAKNLDAQKKAIEENIKQKKEVIDGLEANGKDLEGKKRTAEINKANYHRLVRNIENVLSLRDDLKKANDNIRDLGGKLDKVDAVQRQQKNQLAAGEKVRAHFPNGKLKNDYFYKCSETIWAKLKSFEERADVGRKDYDKLSNPKYDARAFNSNHYNAMIDSIKNAIGEDGITGKSVQEIKATLENIRDTAQSYIDTKNKQIFVTGSNQRKIRLNFAAELVEFCNTALEPVEKLERSANSLQTQFDNEKSLHTNKAASKEDIIRDVNRGIANKFAVTTERTAQKEINNPNKKIEAISKSN